MDNNPKLKVVIVGTGYVGLTTGVCLGYLGHEVVCVDVNEEIVEKLRNGLVTLHEPGIDELLREAKNNVSFTSSFIEALPGANIVVIAVGTPPKSNGDADVSAVEKVAEEIGEALEDKASLVVVNKSTVPIGSARRVDSVIRFHLQKRGVNPQVYVASNPEFLREGVAIKDTLYPDRVVVGAENVEAINVLRQLYAPILEQTFTPPKGISRPAGYELPAFITTNPTSAELIKYAANSFLAAKISLINEFAGLAERVGADIKEVARGIGLDKRIGSRYLEAGLGWGGSCFAKDTTAIVFMASQSGYAMPLVQSAIDVNYKQRMIVIDKLQASLKVIRGNTIGILGLAFKPNTDDLRDAPSIDLVEKLLEHGARVRVYDPVAMSSFQRQFGDLNIEYCQSPEDLAIGCDALVLVTEWPEFAAIDWEIIASKVRQKNIVDGRNVLDREELGRIGFTCQGIGR